MRVRMPSSPAPRRPRCRHRRGRRCNRGCRWCSGRALVPCAEAPCQERGSGRAGQRAAPAPKEGSGASEEARAGRSTG